MATTKTDIQTKINTIADGVLNPASTVRDVLGTNADSLLESIYSVAVDDDETSQTYTTSNAIFDYKIRIWKVGSNVYVSGNFDAVVSIDGGATIFEITDADFTSTTTGVFNFVAVNSTNTLGILLSNSVLTTRSTIFAGESYDFTIIYKALN